MSLPPYLVTTDNEIIDDFIKRLPIRSDRYQLQLADDFLICVRPDGVKQWLYASPSHQRSGHARVLGRFPSMKLTQARTALHYARQFTDQDEELTIFNLDSTEANAQYPINLADRLIRPQYQLMNHRQHGSLVISAIAIVVLIAVLAWWAFVDPNKEKNDATEVTPIQKTVVKTETKTPITPKPKIDAPDFSSTDGQSTKSIKPKSTSRVDSNVQGNYFARAGLTTGIQNREPVDSLGTTINLSRTSLEKVYFFSELSNLANQQVSHRWVYNDETAANITFNVGNSSRWRVYSSKTLADWMTGDWRVELVHSDGRILEIFEFSVR